MSPGWAQALLGVLVSLPLSMNPALCPRVCVAFLRCSYLLCVSLICSVLRHRRAGSTGSVGRWHGLCGAGRGAGEGERAFSPHPP